MLGLISFLYVKLDVSPVVAQAVMNTDSDQFRWMLRQQIPQSVSLEEPSPDSVEWGNLLFRLITQININDPRTFFGGEIPAFRAFQYYTLDNQSETSDYTDHPIASPEPEIIYEHIVEPLPEDPPMAGAVNPLRSGYRVFIYNTHYWESFLSFPEFTERNITDPDKATHKTKNITLVSRRLAQQLQNLGIQASIQNTFDYQWDEAYSKTEELVLTAMSQASQPLDYILDIHRDNRRKEDTTVEIDGKAYARIFAVIGTKDNDRWRENYAQAVKIKEKMDSMYPGLFEKVLTKSTGHGEYNQSLSTNIILLEIGGVDNTLEELYRSTDALGEVMAELIMDAKSVNADTR